MLPDDCSDCPRCGVPVFGSGGLCLNCESVTDNRGRFVKREVADRYRALVRRSLYRTNDEDCREAQRQLAAFWETTNA